MMQVHIDTLRKDVGAAHDKIRELDTNIENLENQLMKYKFIMYGIIGVFAFLAKAYNSLFGELHLSIADIFVK